MLLLLLVCRCDLLRQFKEAGVVGIRELLRCVQSIEDEATDDTVLGRVGGGAVVLQDEEQLFGDDCRHLLGGDGLPPTLLRY